MQLNIIPKEDLLLYLDDSFSPETNNLINRLLKVEENQKNFERIKKFKSNIKANQYYKESISTSFFYLPVKPSSINLKKGQIWKTKNLISFRTIEAEPVWNSPYLYIASETLDPEFMSEESYLVAKEDLNYLQSVLVFPVTFDVTNATEHDLIITEDENESELPLVIQTDIDLTVSVLSFDSLFTKLSNESISMIENLYHYRAGLPYDKNFLKKSLTGIGLNDDVKFEFFKDLEYLEDFYNRLISEYEVINLNDHNFDFDLYNEFKYKTAATSNTTQISKFNTELIIIESNELTANIYQYLSGEISFSCLIPHGFDKIFTIELYNTSDHERVFSENLKEGLSTNILDLKKDKLYSLTIMKQSKDFLKKHFIF